MNDLHFSSGSIDITPQMPLPLAGYAARKGVFEKVADNLEANAIILRDGSTEISLISLDLLYVGSLLRKKILEKMAGHFTPDRLFLSASHTHFAPATDPSLPLLGETDAAYVEEIAGRICRLLQSLLAKPFEKGSLQLREGKANHNVNRRRYGWSFGASHFPFIVRECSFRPNSAGIKDETVIVARLNANSKTSAVIWNYACHPVCFPHRSHVSADFPGVVRRQLREEFGQDVAILFWQGFSGNLRPNLTRKSIGLRGLSKRFLFGEFFGKVSKSEWMDWANSLARVVLDTSKLCSPVVNDLTLATKRVELPLSQFLINNNSEKVVVFHCVSLGDNLRIVGVSAEVMCEHGALLKRMVSEKLIIPVGCIDGVYGYMPTARMIGEGGYEAEEFMKHFSLDGNFADDIDERCKQSFELIMQ